MALKLKNKQVLNLLNEWATDFLNHIDTDTAVQFSAKSPLGSGSLKHSTVNGSYEIEIGIAPLSTSFLAQNKTVDDLNFVKLGIVMFHEFAHYDHNTSEEISKDILLSDLSKFQNNQYYEFNWSVLPHEIDAEYTGVISMWMHLKDSYPNEADKLMTKRLTDRARTTKYILSVPDGGFQSKEQITQMFEDAYDCSLNSKRIFPSGFLRFDDEISRLFTTEDRVLRAEYQPFYRQLVEAQTGKELDLKMASLVSYLHPDLQPMYPRLNFKELNPKSVFGIFMPETVEEIRTRIDMSQTFSLFSDNLERILSDDFTKAVSQISVSVINDFTEAVSGIPLSSDNDLSHGM